MTTAATFDTEAEADGEEAPHIFSVIKAVEEQADARWESYIRALPSPIDPTNALRNEVLGEIVQTLEKITSLTGWDMGISLVLAGCQSTVASLPVETADTEVLQRVSKRLIHVHGTVATVSTRLGTIASIRSVARPLLVRGLVRWESEPDCSAFSSLYTRNWAKAQELASRSAEAACALVSAVETSSSPPAVSAMAEMVAASYQTAQTAANRLVHIVVASGVLDISGGASFGLLIFPSHPTAK